MDSLKLYTTTPHPCSYFDDREAITVFVDPKSEIDIHTYSWLSLNGFRRSGNFYYRPNCEGCNACIPARINVERFTPNRSQKRNIKANRNLSVSITTSIADAPFYELYEQYINQRHPDGDMWPPSREQFDSFLGDPAPTTRYLLFREEGKLLAVSVIDMLENGLSAVYTYFDPDYARRGLGNYAILWQIAYTRKLGLPSLYLGYWIPDCQKMSYKSQFQPLEIQIGNQWTPIDL